MDDHPILGAAIFVIGVVVVGFAYYSSNVPLQLFDSSGAIYNGQEISFLILGHLIMCNGVALVVLGCRQSAARSQMKRRIAKNARARTPRSPPTQQDE
jgi:hypothetical protein